MSKIKVTCDSTCDLSPELIAKYDITVLPLYVYLGDREFRDEVDISAENIFMSVSETGVLPRTAAVSVEDYKRCFGEYLGQGYEIIHVDISSKMSACFTNASIAAKELGGGVYTIDSLNLSTGSGHLAVMAAELSKDNYTAAKIAEILNNAAKRLEVSFVVDTVDYLKKGGRCSSVAALGANLLKLRPCIEVKDGEMGVGEKYRGTMEKVLTEYVRERLENRTDVDTKRIFITHTHAPSDIVKQVRREIQRYQPFTEIIETFAGCTITSHCGKGTLGILFFTKEK